MPHATQLTIPDWLNLSPEQKAKLIEAFRIPATGERRFIQEKGVGRVVADGHSHADLSVITLDAMAAFLGTEKGTDFHTEFARVLDRIDHPWSSSDKEADEKALKDNPPQDEAPAPAADSSAHVPDSRKAKKK